MDSSGIFRRATPYAQKPTAYCLLLSIVLVPCVHIQNNQFLHILMIYIWKPASYPTQRSLNQTAGTLKAAVKPPQFPNSVHLEAHM